VRDSDREIRRLPSCSCTLYRKNSSGAVTDGGSYVPNGWGESGWGWGSTPSVPSETIVTDFLSLGPLPWVAKKGT